MSSMRRKDRPTNEIRNEEKDIFRVRLSSGEIEGVFAVENLNRVPSLPYSVLCWVCHGERDEDAVSGFAVRSGPCGALKGAFCTAGCHPASDVCPPRIPAVCKPN